MTQKIALRVVVVLIVGEWLLSFTMSRADFIAAQILTSACLLTAAIMGVAYMLKRL